MIQEDKEKIAPCACSRGQGEEKGRIMISGVAVGAWRIEKGRMVDLETPQGPDPQV